jgi:hypothetical protein
MLPFGENMALPASAAYIGIHVFIPADSRHWYKNLKQIDIF